MREGEKEAVTQQPRVSKRGNGRKDEGDGERRRQRKQQEEEQHMSAARSERRRGKKNPGGEGMKKGGIRKVREGLKNAHVCASTIKTRVHTQHPPPFHPLSLSPSF